MSFPLSDYIYDNLEIVYENVLYDDTPYCGVSAESYLNLRMDDIGDILADVANLLDASPVEIGDVKFKAEKILQQLIYDIDINTVDGFYHIIISDGKRKPLYKQKLYNGYPIYAIVEEVSGHIFVIEKSGDKFCLIHTHYQIGGRSVCKRPVCRVNKEDIINRLSNIANLLTSDDEEITWSEQHWSSYLTSLGLPIIQPPENLTIEHRRCLWVFVPVGTKGSLVELKKRIEGRQTFYHKNKPALYDLITKINYMAYGTNYLDDITEETKQMLQYLKETFNDNYFYNIDA